MKLYLFILAGVMGCSSSRPETARMSTPTPHPAPPVVEVQRPVVEAQRPVERSQKSPGIPWKPHFVATGSFSGIMVEFTGMKKGKPLNARFACIEVGQAGLPDVKTYTTTINPLRQAFFEITPGVYTVHQTRAWADQSSIRDLRVKEGHYSVLHIAVINPKIRDITEKYR